MQTLFQFCIIIVLFTKKLLRMTFSACGCEAETVFAVLQAVILPTHCRLLTAPHVTLLLLSVVQWGQ